MKPKLREVEGNLLQVTRAQKWWKGKPDQVLALPHLSALPIHRVVTSPGKANKA